MALTDLTRISTSGIATGTSLSGAILHGDAHFRGTQVGVTSALFDSSDNALEFNDNVKLTFGNSGDMMIYHDGSHSHIFDNGTGDLRLTTGGQKIDFQKTGGEVIARFYTDGANELYYDGTKRFNTTSTGAVVTGILTATSFSGPLIGSPINNPSGISTFYDLRVSNNLTVEGTTTTLDTNLIGVDRVEVGANSNSVVGVAITQSGTADIINLFDGASQVVTVDDTGNVGLGSAVPESKLTLADGTNPILTLRRNGTLIAGNHISYTDYKGNNTVFGRIGYWVDSPGGGLAQFRIYSGNNIRMTVGSAGDCPIYLLNDNDTYWSHPANNNHAFTTAGVERFRIDHNGKIGIGTDIPGNILDVQGTTHTKIHVGTTGTGHATGIQINHAKGNAALQQWQLQTDASADGNLKIRNATSSTDVMFFDADSNNIGIGVNNPGIIESWTPAGTYLHVGGTTASGVMMKSNYPRLVWNEMDQGANSAIFQINMSGGDTQFQHINDDGSIKAERLRITSDGQLLVGTTSSGANVRAVFQGYNGGGENFQARVQFQTNQATNLSAGHHLANLLFTNASNSVGAQIDVKADADWGTNDYPARIEFKTTADGANSPTERLRITSGGNITFGVQDASTAVTSAAIKHFDLGRDYWNGTKGDYRALRLRIYDNGNIDDMYGLGVSNGQLEIQSQSSIGFYASGAGAGTGRRVERVVIKSDGNVGINETSPDNLLHLTTNSSTTYSTSELNTVNSTNALLRLENANGGDGSGVNNFVGIYFRVANGANSDSQLQYVRTGDNAGAFHFKARNTGTSYPNLAIIKSDGTNGLGVLDPKSRLHLGASQDIRIGGQYGGMASMQQQVQYSSGYTGTHWQFKTSGGVSWSFDGVLIVHGTGGSSYGSEVVHIKIVYSRESGATNSGDTWRNGSVDYNVETLEHGQVGLNPSAGDLTIDHDSTPGGATGYSLLKLGWSASGQSVGVWSKLIGNFYWGAPSSGDVEIQDKDANIVFNSNP